MNAYLDMMDIHQDLGHLNYMALFRKDLEQNRSKEMKVVNMVNTLGRILKLLSYACNTVCFLMMFRLFEVEYDLQSNQELIGEMLHTIVINALLIQPSCQLPELYLLTQFSSQSMVRVEE